MVIQTVYTVRSIRLYVPDKAKNYPALAPFIGSKTNTKTASLMLRKLASYPRQNGLTLALRELGRIERTIFTLSTGC